MISICNAPIRLLEQTEKHCHPVVLSPDGSWEFASATPSEDGICLSSRSSAMFFTFMGSMTPMEFTQFARDLYPALKTTSEGATP